ncbi:MAG: system FeS assembly protein NifU family [Paenibacillus sp.]|jgi:nitrogen fixation NifU-like protein|nr:system FeS assembly protein NifU family [Paenibacillus sp.]
MLEQLYRQIVMDHYNYPRNYGKLDHPEVIRIPYKNPTCGDAMILYAHIDQGVISEIKFEGSGCSISMASCSMMTMAVREQSVEEAHLMVNQFELMIKSGITLNHPYFQDAVSLAGVHSLRGRHNCALMGWQALTRSLQQHEDQHVLINTQ